MQHKNIEELEKEFDEKFPEPIWIIADVGGDTDEIDLREQLKSLLLSAYNLGVEKSIEVAKGMKKEPFSDFLEPPYNQALDDLTSQLTNLLTKDK